MDIGGLEIQEMSIAFLQKCRSPKNPRRRPKPVDPEYQSVERSLEKFGMVDTVVFNKRTQRIVGGHLRVDIMAKQGVETTAVSIVDLDEDLEEALNLHLNKGPNLFDEEMLTNIFQNMDPELVQLTGFSDEEYAAYLSDDYGDDVLGKDEHSSDEKQTKNRNYLTFGKERVLLTDDDVLTLQQLYKHFLAETGMDYGFVTWLTAPRKVELDGGEQ